MKKLLTAALLLIATTATAQPAHPRLVVGLVVDQMRWDYLYYYNTEYTNGGLRRLLREGYSCENTNIDYAPTVTAIGHSAVYTGTVPALSGIAGNYFCENDSFVYVCSDEGVRGVGADDKKARMSPKRLLASTIGDQLKLSNGFRSKVIGIAVKDRASILPAGHSADAAYWWDQTAGHFVSSTFYMNSLPKWVEDFNKENHTAPGYDLITSNEGVTMTFRMAEAALKNEHLGKGEHTDMLAVSISSTDAIGHTFSTRGKENHDVWMQLDRDMSHFLETLDKEVGKGNYLLFLTADHGAAHNYNYLRQHRIPAGAWEYDKSVKELNAHLKSIYGIEPVIGEDNYQFYLDDKMITTSGLKKQTIVDAAVQWLEQDPQYLFVTDNDHLQQAVMPEAIRQRLINGYRRGRSGEIGIVTAPMHYGATNSPDYRGTTHGQPFPYDTHIPLIFFGWNVPHGSTSSPTNITDIAPTVCQMLHIQTPNAAIGKVIELK